MYLTLNFVKGSFNTNLNHLPIKEQDKQIANLNLRTDVTKYFSEN